MVKSVVEDQADLSAAEGQTVHVKLSSVAEKGPFKGRNGEFRLLEWSFQIAGGVFDGEYLAGTTGADLTTHSDNQYRNWVETLIGAELKVGQAIDTDDLVGLEADAQVKVKVREWQGREIRDVVVGSLFPSAPDLNPPY